VADIGEEHGLGAVDFRQRLGAFLGAFIFIGTRDRSGDLRGQKLDETSIAGIEQAMRVKASDQIPHFIAVFGAGNCRNQCSPGRSEERLASENESRSTRTGLHLPPAPAAMRRVLGIGLP